MVFWPIPVKYGSHFLLGMSGAAVVPPSLPIRPSWRSASSWTRSKVVFSITVDTANSAGEGLLVTSTIHCD